MLKKTAIKDGPYAVVYTWEIDETKPRIWLDGCYYRFNSEIINREQFKTMEEAMAQLNAVQTEFHEPA